MHDLHIYYPGGSKTLRNVSRRTTGVCSIDIMLTREIIEAGKFDVSCTYMLYSPAADSYAGEYTDTVTIELTTAENAFDRWIQNVKRDFAQGSWTIILLICVFIAIASFGGEIIGIIFWR